MRQKLTARAINPVGQDSRLPKLSYCTGLPAKPQAPARWGVGEITDILMFQLAEGRSILFLNSRAADNLRLKWNRSIDSRSFAYSSSDIT